MTCENMVNSYSVQLKVESCLQVRDVFYKIPFGGGGQKMAIFHCKLPKYHFKTELFLFNFWVGGPFLVSSMQDSNLKVL